MIAFHTKPKHIANSKTNTTIIYLSIYSYLKYATCFTKVSKIFPNDTYRAICSSVASTSEIQHQA
jgi:hypothetical protein